MKQILRLSFILFLVCAITAGILGVVNNLTKDRIAEINEAKEKAAFTIVLDAAGYSQVDFDSASHPNIDGIFEAEDGSGWVVKSTFTGAQGKITMVTGVDKEFYCTGISVISHSETSGLGANAAASSEVGQNFRAQFIGQGDTIALSKSGGEIDALTGATITSKAVTSAVKDAIIACAEVA